MVSVNSFCGHCSWTISHPFLPSSFRFNIAADLIQEAKEAGELGFAGILAWMRFMATRQLIWNKNYNVKPRYRWYINWIHDLNVLIFVMYSSLLYLGEKYGTINWWPNWITYVFANWTLILSVIESIGPFYLKNEIWVLFFS